MRPDLYQTLITTPRLVLRPAMRGDYRDWAGVRQASRAHLEPWEPRWSEDALSKADWSRRIKAWHNGWREGRAHVFLARNITDETLIGGVSLTNVRFWPANAASLGYWLGVEATGQGYMTEAVAGVCNWAFNSLPLERLEAGTLPENTRSQSVLTRLGFQEEGRAQAYLEIAGKRQDHILYGLVRDRLSA